MPQSPLANILKVPANMYKLKDKRNFGSMKLIGLFMDRPCDVNLEKEKPVILLERMQAFHKLFCIR